MPEKTVAQKLMIKESHSVLFVNAPERYESVLGKLPKNVTVVTGPSPSVDLVQVFVYDRKQLEEVVPKLKSALTL